MEHRKSGAKATARPAALTRPRKFAQLLWGLAFFVLFTGCPKNAEIAKEPEKDALTPGQFNDTWNSMLQKEEYDQARRYCESRQDDEALQVDALVCLANLDFLAAREAYLNVDTTYGGLAPGEAGQLTITEENVARIFKEVVVYDDEGIDRALSRLDRAIELAPSRPDLWKGKAFVLQEAGRHEELLAFLRLMAREGPAMASDDITAYGKNYLRSEKYREAADVYALCSELYPDDFLVWADYGAVYGMLGEYERALDILGRAEALGEDDVLLTNLANINIYLGRMAEALPYLEKMYKRNPDYEADRFRYLFCLMAVDPERARLLAPGLSGPSYPDVSRLVEILEGGYTGEDALGWAQEFYDEGANELCLIALAMAPDDPRGLYLKAAVYNRVKYAEGEKQSLVELLERAPAEDSAIIADAHFHLGALLIREGNYGEAEVHLDKAGEGGIDTSELWLYLGYALMKQGRDGEAVAAFEKSIVINDKPAAVGLSKVFIQRIRGKSEPTP